MARRIAAHLLEAAAEDIVAEGGSLHVAGTPSKSISWAELAVASRDASKLPEGLDPEVLRHELDFDGTNSTFPFGAHVSVVEVDTETGKVVMRRHIAVDDCGRILNPLLVAGQQHGGIAQGAAQALYEWVRYDEDGNPVTGTLLDYTVPSAAELPSYETSNTQTDSPRNPLGAKGIGESGTIGSTPAIHNAVVDALSHLGVTHIDMPCTPERVWAALQRRLITRRPSVEMTTSLPSSSPPNFVAVNVHVQHVGSDKVGSVHWDRDTGRDLFGDAVRPAAAEAIVSPGTPTISRSGCKARRVSSAGPSASLPPTGTMTARLAR